MTHDFMHSREFTALKLKIFYILYYERLNIRY